MSDAPKYSCDTKATASPSGDGTSYTFDVSAFAAHGTLGVAILPTQPTDRVVFDPPTTSSLTSTQAPATSTESTPIPAGSSAPAYSTPAATGSSSFTAPDTPLPEVPGPASATLPAESPRASTAGATGTAASVPASTSGSNSHGRVLAPI